MIERQAKAMLTMPWRNRILAGSHQSYSSAQLRSCFTAD